MIHILIVGTDCTGALIGKALRDEDYQLDTIPTLEIIGSRLDQHIPDLMIIEATHLDGLLLCKQMRANPLMARLPMLFLTKVEDVHAVAAILNAGGDDHLRTPFAERELAARVRALLRRAATHQHAALTLEPSSRSVLVAGRRAVLTSTEYDLLTMLYHHSGKPLSAAALLQLVWHYPPGSGDLALVRNHIHNLRDKIEEDPDHPTLLISRHGRGYLLTTTKMAVSTMPSVKALS